MSKELPHVISLVLGDWSGDGHEKTESVIIRCNVDHKKLEAAYKAGVKKTGVDVCENVAADYEDNTISQEDVEKLSKFGFKIEDYSEENEPNDEDTWRLWIDGFTALWLFVAKVGNPDIEFKIVHDDQPCINIGGYGLF